MGQVNKKSGQLMFVLFTSKWSVIKNPKEIKEYKAKKSNTVKASNKNSALQ